MINISRENIRMRDGENRVEEKRLIGRWLNNINCPILKL
jgi:hypothetical protein